MKVTEFIAVMREYSRMCEKNIKCENCPIGSRNNGRGIACHLFVRQFSEEAERIIMQWAAENPITTNQVKFREVFGVDILDLVNPSIDIHDWIREEYKGR